MQIKLSDEQEKERSQLQAQLKQETEMLTAYQSKVRKVTEAQHERELKDLEQKVSLRRAILEQRVSRVSFFRGERLDSNRLLTDDLLQTEEETARLMNDRSERMRLLLERQGLEIEEFDAESLRMGFSTVVITNYGDRVITLKQIIFRDIDNTVRYSAFS